MPEKITKLKYRGSKLRLEVKKAIKNMEKYEKELPKRIEEINLEVRTGQFPPRDPRLNTF